MRISFVTGVLCTNFQMAKESASIEPTIKKQKANPMGPGGAVTTRQRASYSLSFKMEVVRMALRLPPSARIKPTCRAYPGIEPVQIRKWIRNFTPLIEQDAGENNPLGAAAAVAAQHRLQLPTTAPPINYRRLALAGAGRLPGHAAHLSTAAGLTPLTLSLAGSLPGSLPTSGVPSHTPSPAPGSPIASGAMAGAPAVAPIGLNMWAPPSNLGRPAPGMPPMAPFEIKHPDNSNDQRLDVIDPSAASCWRLLGANLGSTLGAEPGVHAHMMPTNAEPLSRTDTTSSVASFASTVMWPNGQMPDSRNDSTNPSARQSPAVTGANPFPPGNAPMGHPMGNPPMVTMPMGNPAHMTMINGVTPNVGMQPGGMPPTMQPNMQPAPNMQYQADGNMPCVVPLSMYQHQPFLGGSPSRYVSANTWPPQMANTHIFQPLGLGAHGGSPLANSPRYASSPLPANMAQAAPPAAVPEAPFVGLALNAVGHGKTSEADEKASAAQDLLNLFRAH